MAAVRIALVGMVAVAAMFVAIRHAPVEPEKADAAISIEALRDVGLMRAAAVVPPPKADPPMILPPVEWPPPVRPARPAMPPPPKADPPPTVTMVARRPRPVTREYSFCSRFGMHKVTYGKIWRCRR